MAELELPLRITLVRPPPGLWFCVQGKSGEFLDAQPSRAAELVLEFTLRDAGGDPPRLLGRCAQGPPATRFVYVNSGTLSGDAGSCGTRRAKVPLSSITRALLESARTGQRLAASIAGTARDGGPVCASVPLIGAGWRWER